MALTATVTAAVDIDAHWPLIRGKCREVLRSYGGYVEMDDLLQEVHLWWLRADQAMLTEYAAEPRQLRLRRTVWRVARDTAERYKRQVTTADPFIQVRYSPSEIMHMLPIALDPEGIPDGGGVQEGPKPHGNLAEGGDVLASLVDVRRALEFAPETDVEFITWLDGLRWNYELAGIGLQLAPDSVRRRAARICERLARWLNHEEP